MLGNNWYKKVLRWQIAITITRGQDSIFLGKMPPHVLHWPLAFIPAATATEHDAGLYPDPVLETNVSVYSVHSIL